MVQNSKGIKDLLVKYKCKKCGTVMKFNHGPVEKLPEHWKSTTCENTECQTKNKKKIKDHLGNILERPRKTAILIEKWRS